MAAMAVNPRSQASTATGQCLQRYLAATMKCLTLDPNTSFFPQVLIKTAESKSGFRLQLLYYARSVAKYCDWNQAPGYQRETP